MPRSRKSQPGSQCPSQRLRCWQQRADRKSTGRQLCKRATYTRFMSAADLRQILRLAAEAREGGRGAAVATVVRSATDEAAPGSRAFIDAEHMVGSLHPSLDEAVRRDAMEAVERGRPGMRSYILGEAMSVGIEGGDIDVFFDVIARPPVLLVVGAGHIAVPLVE